MEKLLLGRIVVLDRYFSERGSKQWMKRHIRDPYVRASREMNYRSRAAFKLIDIDSKYKLLKPGMKVLEIGSAPGSWTQVITKKVKSKSDDPRVVAVDVLKMNSVSGAIFIQGNIFSKQTHELIDKAIGSEGVSLVCSDAAPEFVGEEDDDYEATVRLNYEILEIAKKYLLNGGNFLMKAMQGRIEQKMKVNIKKSFEMMTYVKPQASRGESKEIYILARGYSAGIKQKKEVKKEMKKEEKKEVKKLDLSKAALDKDIIRKALLRHKVRSKD